MESEIIEKFDDSPLSRKHIKWTTLSAFGDYLDAGALVAGAVSAVYWLSYFRISIVMIGLIFAFRQFGMWGGSLIAGPLGDRFGRKAIYTYDLIFYFAGATVIAISTNIYEMVFAYLILSIAIGVDVPTTWSLISEFSPKRNRGGLTGFTNIFWYVGPIVIIFIAIGTIFLGINVFRVVFGSLALIAIITWFLRRDIIESPRWAIENHRGDLVAKGLNDLGISGTKSNSLHPAYNKKWKWTDIFKYWKGLVLVVPLYILWGIPASTYGTFLPYFIKTYAKTTILSSYIGTFLWFVFAIIALIVVYIPFIDKTNRKIMYSISTAIMLVSFSLLIFFPFSAINILFISIILFGFGQGVGMWPLSRLWSTELFPTHIRNTAQGFVWSWNRLIVGFWTLSVAFIISAVSLKGLAIIFTIFMVIALLVGGILGPDSHGKTLEETITDFYRSGKKKKV
ncbi:MFS transporter [Ferroplasma sp.]|uniref:MFS transporter n=1 Tax=Ferroplasma sp. TaxID=2591003 RepID=UPI00261B3A47|nr:MFS transporter [Ferroplasma sp.]